ncbi:protealysin inhibitor emfourin [Frankia sp. AiPs1]|uniref:protealysin inhibitor emfourin n=1 Tax=Frankia sp. AiPs1 TaxID=573493 RepID=UPI00204315E3|nr:protealysin inhibitor emfourin [Frankia sp. AiPs1]
MVLERSGGLLGRPVRRGLDSADLPEPEAARLRELVRVAVSSGGAPARRAGDAGEAGGAGGAGRAAPRSGQGGGGQGGGGQGGGADRFVYTLEIDYIPEADHPAEVDDATEASDATAADHTPAADRTTRVDQQGGRAVRTFTVRTFSEPVPADLRPLLALLRAAPLLPAGGRDTPR